MIEDRYHRNHTYLRISLTDACNLRCAYCMPEEHYDFTPAAQLMQPEEIRVIARTFVEMGVTKIRLTGGEPLARKDAALIVRLLASLPVTLALTTNGVLLDRYVPLLREAELQSVNISLDTLSPEKFRKLTRRDRFQNVAGNIRLAVESGFSVKVNMVVIRGWNEAEIPDFIAWTREVPVQVRFIEFMPFAGNHWSGDQVFPLKEMLEMIGSRYPIEPVTTDPHNTATEYRIPGHRGSFAVISTMSAPFCAGCNRMRLTADGKMKNCLFSRRETDILSALRRGEPIEPLIRENVLEKAEALGGQFGPDFTRVKSENIENRSMISIGG
jgi:cyclic pyranopterin phosphate synthase